MHIAEGFLPVAHAAGWSAAAAPFVAGGLYSISRKVKEQPESKMLLGVSGAFVFALSALKLPSITGSCSHPTGTGLGSLLFGPIAMAPVSLVVLSFQALLLAHGGITTLGANVFSMGVVGPAVTTRRHHRYGHGWLRDRCAPRFMRRDASCRGIRVVSDTILVPGRVLPSRA